VQVESSVNFIKSGGTVVAETVGRRESRERIALVNNEVQNINILRDCSIRKKWEAFVA